MLGKTIKNYEYAVSLFLWWIDAEDGKTGIVFY